MAVWTEILLVSFFISLPFMYDTCRIFRYHLRLATFFILATFTSLLAVFQYKQRMRLIAYFGQQISDLLSVEWRVYGKQNLINKRRRVVLINHQDFIDALGILHLLYCRQIEMDIDLENHYSNLWPFSLVPWLLSRLLCPINFINENFGTTVLSRATTNSKNEHNVFLVPASMTCEDTIRIAVKKKLPIQPIVFSKHYFLNKEKHLFEAGRIIISVMPLIETNSFSTNNLPGQSLELLNKMNTEFDCISKITELSDYQTPFYITS
ncbi:uncharacterized protein LOC126846683 [Adelges cooleyi]|uniref:uncharacterized protein LOC126846683 n=1 Tax=Adelges cooleyi TaxID=133065 RepID=UPI00217F890D|nr:uncharacterized protein LOC126846683 [Adelges cooleyi]